MPIRFEHKFDYSATAVWEILGTPDRVDWVPGVESCTFDGEVRSLDLPGAGAIKERILNRDDGERKIEYSCFESPGTMTSHHACMQIVQLSHGCKLLWQAQIEPIELEPFIKNSMEGALAQLERVLSQEGSSN